MSKKEEILNSIMELGSECSKHNSCKTCDFYDINDLDDSCLIKIGDGAPCDWYIGVVEE